MINVGITNTDAHTVHSFLIFELLSNHERKFVTKIAGTPQIRFTLDKNVRQAGNTFIMALVYKCFHSYVVRITYPNTHTRALYVPDETVFVKTAYKCFGMYSCLSQITTTTRNSKTPIQCRKVLSP